MDQHEKININILKPYENNARTHSADQIEMIENSIREFGFINPVIIDENDMILVGHGRVMAAKQIGIADVPFRRVTNLSEDQKKAYIIADNKLSDMAGWNDELLLEELESIELDMSQFGFDEIKEGDIDIIEDDFGMDELEKSAAEPKSKRGDIYHLGDHVLMCGDSTDINDVKKLMNGNKASMAFTDPPYGMEYQSNMRTESGKFDTLKNDDKILDFMDPLKFASNGFVYICTTWKVLDKWLPLFNKNYELSNMIIWDKGGGFIGDLKHTFGTDYEILLCSNNGAEIQNKRIGSVWRINKDNVNEYKHPTQKPIELSATAIKHSTKQSDSVIDLFGGSGSTLIACEQLNRKCYMMELDPNYVDVIIERWEKFTGKKAVQINGKEKIIE